MPFSRFATLLADRELELRPREKPLFDQAPTSGEVSLALGESPNGVNVIGQYADCDRFERSAPLDCSVDIPQVVNLIYQKTARPFGENDREKEKGAIFDSDVPRHSKSYDGG
jgi:hypothetical protein